MTREEAIEYLNKLYMKAEITDVYGDMDDTEPYETAIDMATEALQEQKTGKWTKEIKHHKDQFQEFDYYTIKCSVCGSYPEKNWHLTHYCPNCGSRMLEEGEEE